MWIVSWGASGRSWRSRPFEEDRRGYGGRFEESDCGSEAWKEYPSGKQFQVESLSTEEKRESGNPSQVTKFSTEERTCGKLRKVTQLSTEEKRESGKLDKVVQLSTEGRDNVKRVQVNELSTEECDNGKLTQVCELSTEERGCGPRRLPHVSRRGGEHSHGYRLWGVRLKNPVRGQTGESPNHVRLQSPAH